MDAKLTRREAAILAVAGVGALAVPEALAASSDTDSQNRRLEHLQRSMAGDDARLADLDANWVPPNDPDRPATLALLTSLKSRAQSMVSHIDSILARTA